MRSNTPSVSVRMRIPASGRPIIMQFNAPPFMIEFRRTDQPHIRLMVRHKSWRHPYRDLVLLDYHEHRYRLARMLAGRTNMAVDFVDDLISYCYDLWYRESRQSYTATVLASLETQSPLEYLLDPLLPIGATTILVGDGGVGKSACALVLAQAWLAQVQKPFSAAPLGEFVNWHYYDWERISVSVFQQRCRLITRAFERRYNQQFVYSLEQKGILSQIDSNLLDFAETLYTQIDAHKPKLVIIDSLSAAVGGSLNDEKVARDVMNLLNSIAQLGCAVLAIAHVAKEEARTKTRVGPFGSRMYYNLARQVLELVAEEDSNYHSIYVTKNNYGSPVPTPFRYHLNWQAGQIQIVGS